MTGLFTPSQDCFGMPLAEYRSLLRGDIDDFVDEEGRPIGEIRASASVRRLATTRYQVCRYPGARGRSGLSMNASALKQTGREWPRVMGTVEYLRNTYLNRNPANVLTLLELARMAAAGLLLPAYLMFRGPGARNGTVPAFVSATHKMLAGIFGVSKNMLLCQIALGRPYDRILADPAGLFQFAESSGMLVGQTGTEVCAGPPAMIDEALRLMVLGQRKSQPDREPVEKLLGSSEAFLDYTEAAGDVALWEIVFALRARELVRTIYARLEDLRGKAWTEQQVPALAAFGHTGFGVRSLPMADALDDEAAEAMACGLVPLFRDLPADEERGPLFRRDGVCDSWAGGALLTDRVVPTARGGRIWDVDELEELGDLLARCVQAEVQALRMFCRLQNSVHLALKRQPPARPFDGRALAALFGTLPSSCLAQALNMEIRITVDGAFTEELW